MKSPFHGLPDLIVIPPSKDVRLTLTPDQAAGLFAVLDTFMEEESLPALRRCLEQVYDQLADKLSFKAAE